MFTVNKNLTINYLLSVSYGIIKHTDFDVRVINPEGYAEINIGAIKAEDFIAPNPIRKGGLRYTFKPDTEGVWTIKLSRGNIPPLVTKVRVSKNDNTTHQQVV